MVVRVAAAQLLPLVLYGGFPLTVNTGISAEGFWQACRGGQDAFFLFLLIPFSTYRTLLEGLPGILALRPLPILVAHAQVAPGPPLSFLLPAPASNR